MSKKPESILKEKILAELRKLPCSWWEKIQQVGKRGTPDIIGCFLGSFYAIEIKEKITGTIARHEKLQMYKLRKIMDAGGAAIIITETNWKMQIRNLWKRFHQSVS